MRYLISTLCLLILIFVFSFRPKNAAKPEIKKEVPTIDFVVEKESENDTEKDAVINVSTTNNASALVEYAKTLTGTPYLYGSVDPAKGFDCSGFINHVSNHFGIKVPRSSVEFTNFGTTINTTDAMPGDFILFTGTEPGKQVVGHIGIITDNTDGEVEFIHSSSGKANGVTISELKGYYETRFVKVIRIFQSSEEKIFA